MSSERRPAQADRPSRRRFLCGAASCVAGAGAALIHDRLALAAELFGAQAHAPGPPHHPAKARQLLMVFLTGGFAHVDTFDPKPKLRELHGKTVPAESLREKHTLPILASPYEFRRCGRSGLEISELFPHLQNVADELCVLRTLHTDILEHFQATLAMHTGSATVPMPSLGSWLSFGLGALNRNLPAYVVVAENLPYAGAQVFDCGFLPPTHQGARIVPGPRPVADLESGAATPLTLRELEQRMLRDLEELGLRERPQDLARRGRAQSFETAQGMMREAPEVFDLAVECDRTLERYGCARGDNRSFAWQCLVARRLLERGVRVVELIDTGSSNNWDAHGDTAEHRPKARRVDQALAGLIFDLKQRGMLESTLVMVCTEFGRTPWAQDPGAKGRNHWHRAFSSLLCGAGVRGGISHGVTDELGAAIVEGPVHVHDYHATILHLFGIDHTRLTYRYAGRDFRLTDVAGRVIQEILV